MIEYSWEQENTRGDAIMAKTEKGKKIVPVKPYKKSDGTKVKRHRRSTPN
jgi:hypothetical protein